VKLEQLPRFPARKVRLGRKAIKATKGIQEILEQLLPFPGLKATPEILAHKVFRAFPAKLERQAQPEQQAQPGQKEIREILGTLGQPEQLEQVDRQGHKATKEFRGSKEIREIPELYLLPLPLLTTRKLGLFLYLLQLLRSTEPR
jgi:hypothetical protein